MHSAAQTKSILQLIGPEFAIGRGKALPLGATVERGGVNFALFAQHATAVTLVLFAPGEAEPAAEFPFDPRYNRTGDIWHIFVDGLDRGVEYGFRVDRQPNSDPSIHSYDPACILLDPYARATSRLREAVAGERSLKAGRRSALINSDFDWEQDQPLNIPMADSILYELQVRAYTRHPAAGVRYPGTFSGLAEKIPYLQALGITAVELMPVMEFDENDNPRQDPVTGARLSNLWGYHPLSFFSLHLGFGRRAQAESTAREFKEMVKAFHRAGIEVLLDTVFNHTGEGDTDGRKVSFRGPDNAVYYMLDSQTGADRNYSGCGNTLNCNHPVVRDLLLDCLRYWVTEMHVDGFRFDLASILGRGTNGEVLANPPLIERLAADPVLAHSKLIAEAWDASGLYQVGCFPGGERWAEWNGKFRDDLRRYVRGDAGMVPWLAARLAGSPDLYQASGRAPHHSVNFITCHDGFTLADLVAYDQKHNHANGEQGQDGCSENFSWNCGVEGPTNEAAVSRLRQRQIRNFATLLLFSHGVPMFVYGDEVGRTQSGNNNAYCQDNQLSWMDWTPSVEQQFLLQFFRNLIALRRAHRALRRSDFTAPAGEPQLRMQWHGVRLNQPDWSVESHSLALLLSDQNQEYQNQRESDHLYLISNSYWEDLCFELPQLTGSRWTLVVDTAAEPPGDSCEPGLEKELDQQAWYAAGARSTVVLLAKAEADVALPRT